MVRTARAGVSFQYETAGHLCTPYETVPVAAEP